VENNEIMEEEVSARPAVGEDADAIRDLKAERDDLKELLLRRQAEFDNFRKRSEKERADFSQYAGMELVKQLLPILDDFDRALKVETADADYAKGVALIHGRLFETLKKQGLEPFDTAGAMFDPNLHQAIERVETDEAEDHAVLGEFQRGYNFKGKLLRPAMVKVAVRP
jgi:molecular chaperone GrpE